MQQTKGKIKPIKFLEIQTTDKKLAIKDPEKHKRQAIKDLEEYKRQVIEDARVDNLGIGTVDIADKADNKTHEIC